MVLALKKLTIIQSLLYMLKFSLMNQNRERLRFLDNSFLLWGFPDSLVGEQSTGNEGDPGSIPGLGRSPGEAKGYPLQYSGLENSMDCIVHGVAKSRTRLNDFHFTWQLITHYLLFGFDILKYYINGLFPSAGLQSFLLYFL